MTPTTRYRARALTLLLACWRWLTNTKNEDWNGYP